MLYPVLSCLYSACAQTATVFPLAQFRLHMSIFFYSQVKLRRNINRRIHLFPELSDGKAAISLTNFLFFHHGLLFFLCVAERFVHTIFQKEDLNLDPRIRIFLL